MPFPQCSTLVLFCVAAPVLLAGCASAYGPKADLALRPTVGSEVSGNVLFFER